VGTAARDAAVRTIVVPGLVSVVCLTVITTACTMEVPDDLVQDVRTAAAELAADAAKQDTSTVAGRDGWLFFAPELRHISVGRFWGDRAAEVTRARSADTADPLPAILDFKQQLDALRVELLLVPVPPKSIIYADRLPQDLLGIPGSLPRLDPAHAAFYETLRSLGIEVLDLTEPFLEGRSNSEGPVYCLQDTHWSGVGCVLAAQHIARAVRAYPWHTAIATTDFVIDWGSTTITGDLREGSDTPAMPREELRLRRVSTNDPTGGTEVPRDPTSPVVLLGDSHNLVFHAGGDMHSTGAGLPDQLAYELGYPIDLVAVRGSGATAARVSLLRRAQRDPSYWTGKRLVVWCFSAREFTEGDGWALVPVTP